MVSPHLSRIARSQVNSSSLHDRLTQEERLLAHARMEEDTVGNKGDASIWAGLRQAVSDPVVWLFAAMAHMHLAANGFKNFVSLLLPPPDHSANFDLHSSPLSSRLLILAALSLSSSLAHHISLPEQARSSCLGCLGGSMSGLGTSLLLSPLLSLALSSLLPLSRLVFDT